MPTLKTEYNRKMRAWWKAQVARAGISRFKPRPDNPAEYDQQTGFLNTRAYFSICMGGNRSGKTETAAQKLARLILWYQPPIWEETPFLIISDTLEQTCGICWAEKLRTILPVHQVDWKNITWHNQKRGYPATVPMLPWPGRPGKRWVLEFRAVGQERRTFQGRRYGGLWFSEQFPWPVCEEALRGCVEVGDLYKGAFFAEFTPIDPDLSLAIEEKYNSKLEGDPAYADWEFFRLNALKNDATPELKVGIKRYLSTISSGLLETRATGAFPSFAGVAYPEFNPAVHVLNDRQWEAYTGFPYGVWPKNVAHRRGIDWGQSAGHPFTCVWGFRMGDGRWFIYDGISIPGDMLYEKIIELVAHRWPWPMNSHEASFGLAHADPSQPSRIMEFSAAGIPCGSAKNDQLEGVTTIRNLLAPNSLSKEPMLFIHASCKNLIRQMRSVRWIRSTAEIAIERGTRMPINPSAPRFELLKWDDDEADALRYMIATEEAYGRGGDFASANRGFDPGSYGIQSRGGNRPLTAMERTGLSRWSGKRR